MSGCGCPGTQMQDFSKKDDGNNNECNETGERQSELRQWPVQLHLVGPMAPYFQKADVLLVADCVPFALADFHKNYIKGASLAIACPKLDTNQEIYLEKITAMIDDAQINTLTVMIMQVPCCGGLQSLARTALANAKRKIPLKIIVVSIQGEILSEDWA